MTIATCSSSSSSSGSNRSIFLSTDQSNPAQLSGDCYSSTLNSAYNLVIIPVLLLHCKTNNNNNY